MEDLGYSVTPGVTQGATQGLIPASSGRAAVLGGGWAGLAAAVELAHAGHAVDVYEAARELGGRARRVVLDGIALDNGQHILLGAYRDTLAIIRKAGGDPRHLLLRLRLELDFPGEFRLRAPAGLPAPLHLLAGLLGAQGLDRADKFAAIRFMSVMQLRRFRLDADISVTALLAEQRQPPSVVRYLWEPLCIAALNTAAADASARIFLNVLRDAFTQSAGDSDLLIPRADLGALFPDLAAATVANAGGRIRVGMAVEALEPSAAGWAVRTNELGETYQRVVCALPPWRAAPLLPDTLAQVKRQLEALVYEPILTCYLQYPPGARLPRPMIGLAREISQWAFDRGQLDGPAGLIAVVVSASGKLRGHAHAALAEAIHAELLTVVPGLPGPQWSRVISEKRATFRAAPGLSRPAPGLLLPGLALAGDFVDNGYPATLEGAVRSGVTAAQVLLREVAR